MEKNAEKICSAFSNVKAFAIDHKSMSDCSK